MVVRHRAWSHAGTITATTVERKTLATQSLENSCKTPAFVKIYPEYQQKLKELKKNQPDDGYVEPPAADAATGTEPVARAEMAEDIAAPRGQRFVQFAAVGGLAIAVGVAYAQYTLWSR